MISEADEAYNTGRYDESVDIWNEVIKQNSNFELAYTQIGKVYLRRGQYKQAMDYFELGNFRGDKITNTTGYNKAFSEFRRETAAKWLGPAGYHCCGAGRGLVGLALLAAEKEGNEQGGEGVKEKVKFAFHILAHPFDGFWDMKREKKGDIRVSLVILALVVVTDILSKQFTAFLFNPDKFAPMDVVFEVNKILLVFLLFCVSNWSVTTLMQGEGTFKDIVMMTGYACLPLVIIPLPGGHFVQSGGLFGAGIYERGADRRVPVVLRPAARGRDDHPPVHHRQDAGYGAGDHRGHAGAGVHLPAVF